MPSSGKINVFYSYAREDENYRDEQRDPREIRALIEREVPWRFVGGQLMAKVPR